MKIPLSPAQVLLLEGADAAGFANAQFTTDVTQLEPGHWQWNAWLDAQGRVLHFFALLRPRADALLAWLPLGEADAMRAALSRFVFRAKVTLDAPSGWVVHALDMHDLPRPPASGTIVEASGGYAFEQPGARIVCIAPAQPEDFDDAALDRWRRADIAAGLPLLDARLRGEFVPQALDLERVDAISFRKGCYPGQEIAARLHFRGGNKRVLRAFDITASDALPPPAPGTPILATDGTTAGHVLYGAAGAFLAVLHESTVEQSLHLASSPDAALSTISVVE